MTPSARDFGRISVCIPTYNGEAHLADAIASATAQTLPPHEILIVDDGSQDASPTVAQHAADADARVRVVHNPARLGLVGNWNRCVELASGDWIKFLFQDDLLAPNCLATLSRGMAGAGAVLGFGGRALLLDSGTRRERAMARRVGRSHLSRSIAEAQLLTPERVRRLVVDSPTRNVFGEPTAAMFRRDLTEVYGPFDETLRQLCDWEFWIRVGVERGVWFDPAQVATFRIHSRSVSMQNQARRIHVADPHLLDAIRVKEKILFDDAFSVIRQDTPGPGLRSVERQLRRHLYRLDLSSPQQARNDPAHRSSASSSLPPATRSQRLVERIRRIGRSHIGRILR